jgi:hypothetical protein
MDLIPTFTFQKSTSGESKMKSKMSRERMLQLERELTEVKSMAPARIERYLLQNYFRTCPSYFRTAHLFQ